LRKLRASWRTRRRHWLEYRDPETSQQLAVYQHALKEKTKQLKSMAAELNLFHQEARVGKAEVEHLTKQLNEAKVKVHELKLAAERARTADRTDTEDEGDQPDSLELEFPLQVKPQRIHISSNIAVRPSREPNEVAAAARP